MRRLLDGVWIMERLRGCNTYFVGSRPDFVLVDSGMASDAHAIESQILQSGFSIGEVRRIVLTHAHEDHVGGAPQLAARSGAGVLCSRDEAPYLQEGRRMPAASALFRFLVRMGELAGRKGARCRIDRTLEDGDGIEGTGLRVVRCPGHTPGSISLYDERRRILFCGDVLFNVNPLTGKAGLRVSIPMFTTDNRMALESARMLSLLDVDALLPGHGEPILEGGGVLIRGMLSQQHEPR